MKKALLYFLLFILSFSLAQAQTDTTKHKSKKAKSYKQRPSSIDANLYKVPHIQRDTTGGDTASLKKKLKLKSVNKNSFGPVKADCPPDANLVLKGIPGVYFEKPHSVAWFTFIAPIDTTLTFDLVPANGTDDIDFLLFKDETGNFYNDVESHKIKPIRSNMARCDKSLNGKTGLSFKGKDNYEPPGQHPVYSSVVKIKKGERYYLAVDNYTNADGAFSLYLHLRWPAPAPPPPRPSKSNHIVPLGTNIRVNITVVDSNGKPVKAKLKILGVSRSVIDTNNVSAYSLTLKYGQKININCIAKGYLLNQSSFRAADTGTQEYDTIYLSSIEEHKNMVLQDIEFEPDQAAFLPEAREPLSNLLDFMQSNPTVHILIKGYVNDPENVNSSKYDENLSEERAKAVGEYLIKNGIEADRMEWVGYGNKDMLYPNPQSWEEQRANRRVEIEVK